jgi:hypothetical protein
MTPTSLSNCDSPQKKFCIKTEQKFHTFWLQKKIATIIMIWWQKKICARKKSVKKMCEKHFPFSSIEAQQFECYNNKTQLIN